MKKYTKRFYEVMNHSGMYLNLFFVIHYFFRQDQIPTVVIPIYFLFVVFFLFSLFFKEKFKNGWKITFVLDIR